MRSGTVAKADAALRTNALTIGTMVPGSDRSSAAPDKPRVQKPNASTVEIGHEQIDRVPGRLNEALKYAVARIEADPRAVAAIVSYLGWNGEGLRGEHPLGGPSDRAHESIEKIVDRAIRRLRGDGFIPEAVLRSIAVAEQSLPILESELCEALLNAKLCFVRFSCEALVSAAAVFTETPPLELVRFGSKDGLVKSGTADGINHLALTAENLMQIRGCANILELTDRAREIFGPNTSQNFTEAVIRTGARFEWLDQDSGWFWYMPNRSRDSNRLIDQIKQIMAVTPSISLRELRAAIRRDHRWGGFAPPLKVLASVCKRLFFIRVDGDTVIRIPSMPQWEEVLGLHEATLMSILQASAPLLRREELVARCRQRGMKENTIKQLMSRSAILTMPAPGMYALVGTTVAAGRDDAPAPRPVEAVSTNGAHGFLPDGRVFLAWKLDSSALRTGVLRVPEPVSMLVQGDYRLDAVTGRELGVLQVRQLACWDARRLLRYAAGDLDDTLIIVLDPRGRDATGIIGDETTISRVMSGDFELLMAAAETDEPEEEQSELTRPSLPEG
jgi:hypothetical protein